MAELIFDELIEQPFTSRGDGTFELGTPPAFRFPFSSALRADGVTTAQADDLFPVTLTAAPNLIISCIASFTPGSPALLTINESYIYKTSDVGGGVPAFGTKTGLAKLTLNAALLFVQDLSGGIANPAALRNVVIPPTLQTFKAAAALTNNQAIMAQCGVGDSGTFAEDYLGGVIAAATGISDSADEEDIFATATSGIKAIRRSIKAWRTIRNKAVPGTNLYQILEADKPNALYGIHVQDRATKTACAELIVRGHASAPEPIDGYQRGDLQWDVTDTWVGIRNLGGSSINIDITPGRIA